jgi:hypothetical protein
MKIFIVIEEDIDGARVVYSGQSKEAAEKYVAENYARELRWLMDSVWRCGSSVLSIQESTLDA